MGERAAPGKGRLVLLWLAGIDLRLTLLAVPPVLPLIHRDLGLDEKGVAAVSSLPVLLLGLAATPGSLLIARVGARRALLAEATDVARLSAGMFTISYTTSFLANLLVGAVWDATHQAATAFLPLLLGGAVVLVLGPRLVTATAAAGPRPARAY